MGDSKMRYVGFDFVAKFEAIAEPKDLPKYIIWF